MRTQWTHDLVRQEALKYERRAEFKLGSHGAYAYAQRHDILNNVCSNMSIMHKGRSSSDLASAALKYKTRSEFQVGDKNAYSVACRRGVLDKICNHMNRKQKIWNRGSVEKEAHKYKTRTKFQVGSNGAYAYAIRQNILDDVCSHMDVIRCVWDVDAVRALAMLCKTRSEFYSYSGAHQHALNIGVCDDILSHLPNTMKCDANIVYIIKVKNEYWNDKRIYKIGVTSNRLNVTRVKNIEYASGFKLEIIDMFKVNEGTAFILEKKLHTYGEQPKLHNFDGYTEFRALSDEQLGKVIKKAKKFQRRQDDI